MTSEARPSERSERESDVLRSFQRASEARGLTFYVDPPRKVIPDFLGNYQPDAIARGSEGGIIIQMTRPGSGKAEKRFAEISQKISCQKGWTFQLVYLNSLDEAPIAKPTWQQVQAALKEIEALASGGHHAAALVSVWAVLEALARLATTESETESGTSPLHAIQALAEEGFIENEVADRLRGLARLRDAVVHGDLSAEVTADQVEMLVRDLRTIAFDVKMTI